MKKDYAEYTAINNNLSHGSLDFWELIKTERGVQVFDFFSSIKLLGEEKIYFLMSQDTSRLMHLYDGMAKGVIHTNRLNNIQHLNNFLQIANRKLENGGHFLCCMETRNTCKMRILSQYPIVLNWLIYSFYYIFKRIILKLSLFERFYSICSNNYNRSFSYTEMLGRFCACGFELCSQELIDGLHYFHLKKVEGVNDLVNKNYGLLIKLPRIGKNGSFIKIYKIRTMYPYAEYLQDYLLSIHGTDKNEKLKDDFRIHFAGAFLRRVWLDELPNLINLCKGDLKIVGVRPLSEQKYKTYPQCLQEKRIKAKPGLVPPYYADMPKSEEEMWETESRYLDAYFQHPWRTDWRYFWKAFHNIVFKGERSA